MSARPPRVLTGRRVLAIAVACFGTVFAVNGLMAYHAVRSFPGVEVANSYVASQGFNTRLSEQQALGWQALVAVDGPDLVLRLTGADGAPALVADLRATLGRATHTRDDQTPAFRARPDGAYAAPVTLAPGNWNLRLVARAADGTEFQQRISFVHRP